MMVRTTQQRGGARMIMPAVVIGTSVLALSLVVGARAEAGPPTETLRQVFTDVNKVLMDPRRGDQLPERVLNVRALLNPVLDFRTAATRSLGEEWRALTGAEQDTFIELFTDLLERSCVAQVATVAVRTGGIRIDYLDEVIDGDVAMVWTAIVTRGGGEVLFDYAMVRREGHWMVRDVFIGGVSLVANLRSQFKRIIRDSSYAGLVVRLKARAIEAPPARAATAIDPGPIPGARSPISGGP